MGTLLFILPADKPWARVTRRAVVTAVLVFISIVIKEAFLPLAPEVWVPVISAILMGLDKLIRELGTLTLVKKQ